MWSLAADDFACQLGAGLVCTERLYHLAHLLLDIIQPHQLIEFGQGFISRQHFALLEGDILGLYRLIDFGRALFLGQFTDTERQTALDSLKQFCHLTSIAPVLVFRGKHLIDLTEEHRLGIRSQMIPLPFGHLRKDLHQFYSRVVIDMDAVGDAAGDTLVDTDEIVHRCRIAGQDHGELAGIVLHTLHQHFDGLGGLSVLRTGIVDGGKAVGLVDEEQFAHGQVTVLAHVLAGTVLIFADDILALTLDDIGRREQLHRIQYLTELTGNGGLTRTGITRQDDIEFHRLLCLETEFKPFIHIGLLRGYLTHKSLHGLHADKVSVKLCHNLIDIEFLQRLGTFNIGTAEKTVFVLTFNEQTLTVALQGTLKGGHHLTGVAEVLRATLVHLLEELVDVRLGVSVKSVAFLLELLAEDMGELVGRIVGKLQALVEAGGNTGVGIEEVEHLLGVAGDDTDEFATQFLDRLQQGIDGLASVVAALT